MVFICHILYICIISYNIYEHMERPSSVHHSSSNFIISAYRVVWPPIIINQPGSVPWPSMAHVRISVSSRYRQKHINRLNHCVKSRLWGLCVRTSHPRVQHGPTHDLLPNLRAAPLPLPWKRLECQGGQLKNPNTVGHFTRQAMFVMKYIIGRGEQRIKNYWKMLGHGSWRLGPLIASSSCSHDCNPLALPSAPNSLDPRLNTHAPKQNEHRMNMNKQYLPRMATPISSAEWRMCNIPWIRMCCKYNLPGIKHIVKPCKTIQCCSSDKPAFSARCSQSKPASTSPAWRGCGCVFALGTWHAKLLLTKSSIASIDYELCIKLTTA